MSDVVGQMRMAAQYLDGCDNHGGKPLFVTERGLLREGAREIERLRGVSASLLEALRPFLAAYEAYVSAMKNFCVQGGTLAERRFSEGEREDTAEEAAFEALASITFEQLAAVSAAISKAEGRT